MIFYSHRQNNLPVKVSDKYAGVEFDVRNNRNCLVIHHEPIEELALPLFIYLQRLPEGIDLAINVKEQGLCSALYCMMEEFEGKFKSYFFFDMAFPDLMEYVEKCPEHTAVRLSEYEEDQAVFLRGKVEWVWVDYFENFEKMEDSNFMRNFEDNKVVVADPSLHGKDYSLDKLGFTPYGVCLDMKK